MNLRAYVPLFEQINSRVRHQLTLQRQAAMKGNLRGADVLLKQELSRQIKLGQDVEVVALAMLRAELFYLDEQFDLAFQQFETFIRPRIDRLDFLTRFVVEQNDVDLRLDPLRSDAGRAASEFYHLYDRRQVAAIEWGDARSLAVALEAIESNNHRKALSELWSETTRTYRQGCWTLHRAAILRLGQEWLRIGEPEDAAYCAILSLDDSLAKAVADDLINRMDNSRIEETIKKVLTIANLARHFCAASNLCNRSRELQLALEGLSG